jgi:fascin 1/2
MHDDGLSADSDQPESFFVELRDPTHLRIKTTQGRFVNSEKNGAIALGSTDPSGATDWEY